MKKLLLALFSASFIAIGLTSCAQKEDNLVFNKRYMREIIGRNIDCEYTTTSSLVFHSNGKGEYTYKYSKYYPSRDYTDIDTHYVINFKYTFVDKEKSAVVCFFDGETRFDGKELSVSSSWDKLYTVSKNVVASVSSAGYTFYINEDYLKTLSNYTF